MNCLQCNKEFDINKRDKILSDNSEYVRTRLCTGCILENLAKNRATIHPLLIKAIKIHKRVRTIYMKSVAKVSKLQKKFKKVDYEYNIIIHNHNMEKVKEEAKRTKLANKEQITAKVAEQMLKNLPEEQRKAVLAHYKQQP